MTEKLKLSITVGRAAGEGWAELEPLTTAQRLRRAAKPFLIGLAVLLSVLLIPLIHFIGLGIFILCSLYALSKLRARSLLTAAYGHCPHCNTDASFFVWDGRQPPDWPMRSYCLHCDAGVKLTPQPVQPPPT